MYQNIYYDRWNERIHLWDDTLGYHAFPYTKYAYINDPDGEYLTLDGKRVRKVLTWTSSDVDSQSMYEHNINAEVRTLIDFYMDSDEISENHCIVYLDIEVARGDKYSEAEDADNTITSISYYDSLSDSMRCLLLDPESLIDVSSFVDVQVRCFPTEHDLLSHFIIEWGKLPITIITGWNVLWYDMQYLYNRIEKVLGNSYGNYLSPIRKVDNFTRKNGKQVFRIAGISILDYMELYKKFALDEQPSYTLDHISTTELGRGKIEYENDLDHLYRTDPYKFIQYNIEDVQLVIDLNKKLDYIGIAIGVAHKGHVPYEDVLYTSKYMNGACLTATKRMGIVATHTGAGGVTDKAKGAFVKRSKPGLYMWVYDLDLTSLYPSNIMSLNISPETKYGKVRNWNTYDFINRVNANYQVDVYTHGSTTSIQLSHDELQLLFSEKKLSIAANGVMYTLEELGFIPTLLDGWFKERSEYRKLSSVHNDRGEVELSEFYERKQRIQKVLLNSLYGVLLLPSFRFYDRDNGEATTLTGQQLIHYTAEMANYYYNTYLNTTGIDYCLYTDTDSVFYEAMPIINKMYPNIAEEDIPDKCIEVATLLQDFINESYDIYAKQFHMLDTHRWSIKQELIAKRAFWGSVKKRYAMWLVRDGSKVVDIFDIKGFDSVRSSFPRLFRDFLQKVIEMVLVGATPTDLNTSIMKFKEKLSEYPINDIMNPTSVKDMEKWTIYKADPSKRQSQVVDYNSGYKKGAPIHVKSALNYNKLKSSLDIYSTKEIKSGDKIRWAYLKTNPYNFDTIGIFGYEDPDELVTFVTDYIHREKVFDRALGGKLQDIWDDLGWGRIIMNPNIVKVFMYD